ncbi:hypothetical protein [Alicyclobacillus sp. SO9]|uniref:hypothetical protein n=1 Tax=Alicyclobacillus sp. SO9 TaxID=2665646 RepID=UPI0018E82567|nr:hypothetical protein [Alicyclobacillus sp. SO9]QQE80422.1 hypothetical protein GI364_08415 [Alicyclobacillus sp. SO9]
MPDNMQELTSTDAHLHSNETQQEPASSDVIDTTMFHCNEGDHDVPISQALYPSAINPSICRDCAAQRRAQKSTKRKWSAEQIPEKGDRGDTKRITVTLSKYAATAAEVLSVGSTVSNVVEEALIKYLAEQDSEVISFVSRIFAKNVR